MSNLVHLNEIAGNYLPAINGFWESTAYPLIHKSLAFGASLFTGTMAIACAERGRKEEKLAFVLFAAAFYLCGTENLIMLQATGDPSKGDPSTEHLRLQMSAISGVLLIAFTLFFIVKVHFASFRTLKLGDVITPVLAGAGVAYAALQPALVVSNDKVFCTLTAVIAAAGLIAWSRRYGLFATLLMAMFSTAFTVPQWNYWEGIIWQQDIMRLGVLGMGVLLAIPLIVETEQVDGSIDVPEEAEELKQPEEDSGDEPEQPQSFGEAA